MLLASLQVALLQHILSPDSFLSWGWRIPFLLSGVFLAVTILWRLALTESPAYAALKGKLGTSKAPISECLRNRTTCKHMLIVFFSVSAAASITVFTASIYTPLYLKTILKIPVEVVNQIHLIAMLAFFPSTVFFGHLSDHIGRRHIFICGTISAIIATPIVFYAINSSQTYTSLLTIEQHPDDYRRYNQWPTCCHSWGAFPNPYKIHRYWPCPQS